MSWPAGGERRALHRMSDTSHQVTHRQQPTSIITAHKEVEYRRVHARGLAVGSADSMHEIIGSNPIVMQFFLSCFERAYTSIYMNEA